MTGASSIADLLTDLAARGVQLAVEGGRLCYRPSAAVSDDLAARMGAKKGELLAILNGGRVGGPEFSAAELAVLARANLKPADVPEVAAAKQAFAGMNLTLVDFKLKPAPITVANLSEAWREMFEERAGIMEFDANLPRERAERLALADIFALMDGSGRKLRSEGC